MRTIVLACIGAIGAVANADASIVGMRVSLSGEHVELSKAQQMGEWIELQDVNYNRKGFTHWKPQAEGFLLKNKDTHQLSCRVKANDNQHNAVNVAFDCARLNLTPQNGAVVSSSGAASARFRAALKTRSKFTPIQDGHSLQPLKPETAFANEADEAGALASGGTVGRQVNIDDTVFEGEANNAELDVSVASEADERKEQKFLDRIDVGPEGLFSREEAKQQTRRSTSGHVKPAHHGEHLDKPHSKMEDTPYVDAGVDREVNDRMYEFFKKHPQYHTPEAHWRAARKWKSILTGAGGANPDAASPDASPDAASPDAAKGMWQKNTCNADQKVPTGWPDVPAMKCQHYAVSPMGYWGCQWLFEDGTCGYIQFYPTIRWDGLDSYVTKNHDPEDADLLQNGAFPKKA